MSGGWTFGEASWVGDLWAEVAHIGGPDRVVHDDPDPGFIRRPVGFVVPLIEQDPMLWEGDDA